MRLIMINRLTTLLAINAFKIKAYVHIVCVCTVYMYYVYINTQTYMCTLRKKKFYSVVKVPIFLYSVPIPVKIHGSLYQFRYQSKTQKHAN